MDGFQGHAIHEGSENFVGIDVDTIQAAISVTFDIIREVISLTYRMVYIHYVSIIDVDIIHVYVLLLL